VQQLFDPDFKGKKSNIIYYSSA